MKEKKSFPNPAAGFDPALQLMGFPASTPSEQQASFDTTAVSERVPEVKAKTPAATHAYDSRVPNGFYVNPDGKVVEKKSRITTVAMKPSLYDKLSALAKQRNMKVNNLISLFLEEHLENL